MKGRQRGRNGGKPRMHHQGGGGGGGNRNFDHNQGRMRGNAQQLLDKYLALARDASSQGDRVLAENYFQHADHYYRVVNERFGNQQGNNNNNQQRRFNGGYDGPDAQGNYNQDNYGNQDIPPPVPSQAYMPQAATTADPNQSQPQSFEQQPYQGDQQPRQHQQHQPREHQPREHQQREHREHQQREQREPREHQQRDHQPRQPREHREPEGDIGLPPTLFGDTAPAEQPAGGDAPAPAARPRHAGRRRFGNRAAQPAAEPTDA